MTSPRKSTSDNQPHLEAPDLVPLEVLTSTQDRPLVQELARTLRGQTDLATKVRAELRDLLNPSPGISKKAVLQATPQEIDLHRNPGREVTQRSASGFD